MNEQTILNAYAKALKLHELNLITMALPTNQLAYPIEITKARLNRRARQMETFAARLAVVQPTKRDALSDDTLLSDEVMKSLGAQKKDKRSVVYTEWWFCERNFIWDGTNLKIGTSNGEMTADGVRTVGELRQLHKLLTDRELE